MITGHIVNGTFLARADGDLNIYSAAQCLAQLRHIVEANASIVLDLSGVSEIDTAGVQLLLQARLACKARGLGLQFVAPSPAVQDIARLLRLHDELDMPCVEHASLTLQDGAP